MWEKYKAVPHDQFWADFVRASRTRIQQLQIQQGKDPNALYTWLVFEDGYRARGAQDNQDYIADINSVRDKYHLHLVPVRNGNDVINYLNNGQDREPPEGGRFRVFRALEPLLLHVRLQQQHRQRVEVLPARGSVGQRFAPQ